MINYTLPVRKDEELRELIEYVQTNPEKHAQETWYLADTCGTVMCLAGHKAVTFDGLEPDVVGNTADRVTCNGEYVSMERYAREALGLTDREAMDLFYSDNSDFHLVAESIMNDEYRPGGKRFR